MVKATVQPWSISRRNPRKPRTAPRLLEPRTFTNPNLRMMRPVHSPSKLSLDITRMLKSRHTQIAGKMQLCQKERIIGRVASDSGPPSSMETAIRSVGPISRTASAPAQVIRFSSILCLRLNAGS